MAKRTVTSKGMRVKLRKANAKIETLVGEIAGLKQQLLFKDNTIQELGVQLNECTIQRDTLAAPSIVPAPAT